MKLALQGDLVVYTNISVDDDGFVILGEGIFDRNKYVIMDMVEGVGVGYRFVNGEFVAPEPLPAVVEVPNTITPRQARLKLLESDLLDNLEAVITTNRAWQIEWEYATEVKRDSPLIDAVAVQSGLTNEQIDQMFIEASKL